LHGNFRVGDHPGARAILDPTAYFGSNPWLGRVHAIPGLKIETWGTRHNMTTFQIHLDPPRGYSAWKFLIFNEMPGAWRGKFLILIEFAAES
jgi:hypothetical protein